MRISMRLARATVVALPLLARAPASADLPGSSPTSAPSAATALSAPPPTVASSAAPVLFKLGPQTTLEQMLALPAGTSVETETGQKMTAAQAKQKMKAREKKLAKLKKKKAPRKKGPLVPAPKPAAASTATAVSTSRALAAAAPAPGSPLQASSSMGRVVATASQAAGAADTAFVRCGQTALDQRYLVAVNGASSASFTPDGVYKIAGCGFGTKRGTVALTGGSAGGMFNVSLLIESWANDAITARVDPKLAGVTDQANIVLVVTRGDGAALQQGGHSFVAATEEVPLASIPPGLLSSSSARQPATVKSPAAKGATLEVGNFFLASTQFCPRDPTTDVLQLSRLPLKPGFAVTRVDVRNLVPQDLPPGGDPEPYLCNPISFGWGGDDFQISPQWLQQYVPKNLFIGGYSYCSTSYELTVYVRGPRGFSPL